MSWNAIFLKGIDLWLNQYVTKENDYYKYERDLCKALYDCFIKASKVNQLSPQEIKREIRILGRTRVDFMLDREVCFEVKFEPDYPEMLSTKKPVTNVVRNKLDREIAKYAGLDDNESQMLLYEVELDLLKLIALKNYGIKNNYLLLLDEDGRLYKGLTNSFKTTMAKKEVFHWQSIYRNIDNKKTYYFLWKA